MAKRNYRLPSHYWQSRKNLPALLAERDARLYGHEPSLDEILMGTPAPGRSALDGWKQRGEAEQKTMERWR